MKVSMLPSSQLLGSNVASRNGASGADATVQWFKLPQSKTSFENWWRRGFIPIGKPSTDMPKIETLDTDTMPSSASQHTPLGVGYVGYQAMMRRVNRAPLAPFSIAADIVYILLSILDFGIWQLWQQIEIVQSICIFRRFGRMWCDLGLGLRLGICELWGVAAPRVASAKWQMATQVQQLHLQLAKLATVGRRQMESSWVLWMRGRCSSCPGVVRVGVACPSADAVGGIWCKARGARRGRNLWARSYLL